MESRTVDWGPRLLRSFLASVLISSVLPGWVRAAEPPGKQLDLSNWKLTLPVDTPRGGRPDEVEPPELDSFADANYFFAGEDGRVVFRAPCGGSTTKGSNYPRCELRELNDAGKDAAWGTRDGRRHTLTARLAVTRTPPVKPHVVCAQIHDATDDLVMVRVEGEKLLVERNSEDDVLLDRDYQLGTPFGLKIEAADGYVKIWYDGELRMNWQASRQGCYFKAGCYTQSNPMRGDAADSYGEVVIERLQVEHPP